MVQMDMDEVESRLLWSFKSAVKRYGFCESFATILYGTTSYVCALQLEPEVLKIAFFSNKQTRQVHQLFVD